MKLVDLLHDDLIFPNLEGTEKEAVLRFMTEKVSETYPEISSEELYGLIVGREKLSSTGVGSGIAIPHAKLDAFSKHVIVFGRSELGIQFDSIDHKPVHLIFMIVGPTSATETHLKALARISKFLHDTSFREQLIIAQHKKDIYEAIAHKDAQY